METFTSHLNLPLTILVVVNALSTPLIYELNLTLCCKFQASPPSAPLSIPD